MPEPKFYTVQVAIVDGEGYLLEVANLYEGYNLEKAKAAFCIAANDQHVEPASSPAGL